MDTKIPRVWDWIAKQCHEQEWHSSANIAEFLASQDEELWGDRVREEWINKYLCCQVSIDTTCCPANFLVAVARYRDFKGGCWASGYNCEDCYVGKKQGRCNQVGSISHFWQYVLEQDSGEKVVEELQEDIKHLIEEF